MPRANRRNIVGHQFPTLLHVASALCAPCCMLLSAAGSCCAKSETGQTLSYAQSDATSQYCWANNVGSFCVRLHVVLVPLIVYTKAQCDSYLQVHTRQWACVGPGSNTLVTCNCGLVLRDYNDVIEFNCCNERLHYDFVTPIRVKVRSKQRLSPGISITQTLMGHYTQYVVSW